MNGMLYASQLGDYIRSERDRLQPLGRSLDESDRFALREHFKADLLADVTLVIGERIREPDLAVRIRAEGMALPILQIADAVTLDRVIAGSQPLSHPTVVHELIHVVQYGLLGVDRFVQRYFQEYLACGYDTMPLEQMAVDLTRRNEAGEIFDVTDSVKDQL